MNAGLKAFRRFYEERETVFAGTAHGLDDHPSFKPVAGTPDQVLKHLEPIPNNSPVTHLQGGMAGLHLTDSANCLAARASIANAIIPVMKNIGFSLAF